MCLITVLMRCCWVVRNSNSSNLDNKIGRYSWGARNSSSSLDNKVVRHSWGARNSSNSLDNKVVWCSCGVRNSNSSSNNLESEARMDWAQPLPSELDDLTTRGDHWSRPQAAQTWVVPLYTNSLLTPPPPPPAVLSCQDLITILPCSRMHVCFLPQTFLSFGWVYLNIYLFFIHFVLRNIVLTVWR